MKQVFFFMSCLIVLNSTAQQDTVRQVRAFPITDYMVDLNDSIKLVQLHLPDGVSLPEKKLGLLKGIYRDKQSDTATIGTGRCQLIKSDYYYFAINYKKSGVLPREGDLIYLLMDKSNVYPGLFVSLSAHYIGLKNVYDTPLYDRYSVFSFWEKSTEDQLIDTLVADIRFTAGYFLKNEPTMNMPIKSGSRAGKMLFNTMLTCTRQDVIDFLEYMIARPNLYAGHAWKVSEVFATWMSEGGPTVMRFVDDNTNK